VLRVMNDPHLTGEQKWKKIGDIIGPIAEQAPRRGVERDPEDRRQGRGARAEGGVRVRAGFLNANVWGKLAIAGWLIHKFGGPGAFASIGRKLGGQTGAPMGDSMARSAATGFKARFTGVLKGALKGVGIASVFSGLASSAAGGGGLGDHLKNFVSGATFGLVPTAAQEKLKNATELIDKFREAVRKAAAQGDAPKVHAAANALEKLSHLGWVDQNAVHQSAKSLNNLGVRLDKLKDNFDRMRKGSVLDIKELRSSVASNFATIAATMGAKSRKGSQAVTTNTDLAVKAIKQFMKDGSLTTAQGMKEMQGLFEAEMKLFGVSGNQANHDAFARAYHLATGNDTASINTRHGNAVGGWIGLPGQAGGDNIPIMVGAGEAVLNRHQQAPVETALRMVYGMGLDDLFSRVQRPHYMAAGGKVQRFAYGGVTAPVANLIRRLDGMGFHHGSTTGGGHAAGSYHYRGQAVDYGDANNDMQRLWSVVFPMRGRFAELFGPSRTRPGPHLMHYGAGFSNAALQAQHENHIHMALTGGAGPLGAAFKAIKRQIVVGPPGPFKALLQGGLDKARGAANAKLKKLAAQAAASASGGGAGGAIGGSGHDRALMQSISRQHGWNFSDWWYVDERETGHGRDLTNPTSTARLRGQFLSMNWGKYGPGSDPRRNPSMDEQIRSMALYIQRIYGNPTKAAAHERAYNWYARGGRALRRFGRGGFVGRFAKGGYAAGGTTPSTSRHWNPFTHAYAFVTANTYTGWQHRWQAHHPRAPMPTGPAAGTKAPTQTRNINPLNGHTETHTAKEWAAIRLQYRQRQAAEARATRAEGTRVRGFTHAILGHVGQLETTIENVGFGIEDAGSAYSHQQRIFDQSTEDMTTPEGRRTRYDEVTTLVGMKQDERHDLYRKRRLIRREAARYKKLIARLRKELKRKGLTAGARKNIQTQLKDAVTKYKDLRRQARQLGIDIEDINLDITDLQAGFLSDVAESLPTTLDQLTAAQAQAELTPDTADDIAAAKALVDYGTGEYKRAVASGDPRKITEAAGNLKGWQDALKSLTDATQAQTDATQALLDQTTALHEELKRQNDQRAAYQAAGERTALDMLTGLISGRMGANVLARGQARTFGTVARA
jgi:hypothetical protein